MLRNINDNCRITEYPNAKNNKYIIQNTYIIDLVELGLKDGEIRK